MHRSKTMNLRLALQPNDDRSSRAAVINSRFLADIDRPSAKLPEEHPEAITMVGWSWHALLSSVPRTQGLRKPLSR
jgi:hypothetical protein